MKYILSLIISGALVVSGFGQTRNVLVGTNNAVVQPTNFWSADATNARSGLGLGTAATNPASAFQPASSALTNLASGNAGSLTNLQATNLVGIIPSSNISTVTFTNISGTLSIASGGTGATNAASARQNLGSTTVGDAVFIATNAAAARTALSLGTAATSAVTDFQPADSDLTNLAANNAINLTNFPTLLLRTNGNGAGLTNLTAANITGTVALASNVSGVVAITNGGSGATTAGEARTNLGLGWSALTNTDATNFRNAIGLGTTNSVSFKSLAVTNTEEFLVAKFQGFLGGPLEIYGTDDTLESGYGSSNFAIGVGSGGVQIKYGTSDNDWGYPVVVDASGDVVRPTNFWQAAPITTTFIESQPTTNFTTNITAARFLHIHSLNTNIVNVTNTIALPTNGSTYNGDIALVVHQGPTNSMTRVRSVGSTNDIVTMTRYNEAIEFVYYNNSWQFNHNEAFTEPIYFAGTNAVTHAAESRTNLGLGETDIVRFARTTINVAQSSTTNAFVEFDDDNLSFSASGQIEFRDPFVFNNTTNAATTRTNLGIPLAALTNTNNANFQAAVFNTNAAPTPSVNFGDAVAWLEITVQTNGTNASFRIPLYEP